MADDNLQVKIDAEAKELFEQMWSESGQSKKDFMASVIAQYQCYSLQKGSDLGIPELNALEQHVRRITEIYTAMAGSRQDIANESDKKEFELKSELLRVKAELLDTQESAKLADAHAKELVHEISTKAKEKLEANKIKIDELIAMAEKAEETAILTKDLLEAEKKMRIIAENAIAEITKRAESTESKFMAAQNDVTKLSIAVESGTSAIDILNKKIADLEAQLKADKEHADFALQRAVLLAEQEAFKQRQADLLELDKLRQLVASKPVTPVISSKPPVADIDEITEMTGILEHPADFANDETLIRIKSLLEKDKSFTDIAKILNNEDLKTDDGKRWTKNSVEFASRLNPE